MARGGKRVNVLISVSVLYLHRPPVPGIAWQYFLAKLRALPLPIASPQSVSSCNSHVDAASGSVGRGVAGAPNGRTMEVLSKHSAAPPPLESRQNVWDRLVGSRAADKSASCVTVAKQSSQWCRRGAGADVHKQLQGGMSASCGPRSAPRRRRWARRDMAGCLPRLAGADFSADVS